MTFYYLFFLLFYIFPISYLFLFLFLIYSYFLFIYSFIFIPIFLFLFIYFSIYLFFSIFSSFSHPHINSIFELIVILIYCNYILREFILREFPSLYVILLICSYSVIIRYYSLLFVILILCYLYYLKSFTVEYLKNCFFYFFSFFFINKCHTVIYPDKIKA